MTVEWLPDDPRLYRQGIKEVAEMVSDHDMFEGMPVVVRGPDVLVVWDAGDPMVGVWPGPVIYRFDCQGNYELVEDEDVPTFMLHAVIRLAERVVALSDCELVR